MSICHLALGNGYPYLRILLDGKSTQSPPPSTGAFFIVEMRGEEMMEDGISLKFGHLFRKKDRQQTFWFTGMLHF